jgi:hypothetical protein
MLRDGRFWMAVWLIAFALTIGWGTLTMLTDLKDKVANVSAMSVAALVLSAAGGVQATLTMRVADPKDPM